MTDSMLSFGWDEPYPDVIECEAYDEASMQTCPCASCQTYRDRQYHNEVYNRRFEAQMERVREAAKKPFYAGWECPK